MGPLITTDTTIHTTILYNHVYNRNMDDKLLTIILHQYDQIAGGYIILLRTVCGCVTGTKVELLKGLLPVGNENMRAKCGEPFYNKMSKIYGDMICI